MPTPTAVGRRTAVSPASTTAITVATTLALLLPLHPAHAQPLTESQLIQQLRPQPKSAQAADDDEDTGITTRGMVMPGGDGRCDQPEVASGSGHRNLEILPAAATNTPRATLDLQFGYASYRLTTADQRQLDALARALQHPELKAARYSITGHTDSSGDPAINLKLSCGRSTEVRDYLVKRGVNTSRLEAFGFGSARPVQPNNAADGANRRVEVRLLR